MHRPSAFTQKETPQINRIIVTLFDFTTGADIHNSAATRLFNEMIQNLERQDHFLRLNFLIDLDQFIVRETESDVSFRNKTSFELIGYVRQKFADTVKEPGTPGKKTPGPNTSPVIH
jgi:hypothetical protein